MLKLNNVTKIFNVGTCDEKKAINNLSIDIKDGDFVTIIGSNGAGKSTLFNLISGNCDVDTGSIELDGAEITNVSEYKRAKYIGRLFQDPMKGTCPSLTIEENLGLAYLQSYNRGLFSALKKQDKDFIKSKLALLDMGLEDRTSTLMGLLSGGQRQAITLLMATLTIPKLLLLDEHTAALDPITAEKVLSITKDVVETNKITTLMITHNMGDALKYGNRLLMMKDGEVVLDIEGDEKKSYTVEKLLQKFKENTGTGLDNDRMLL